MRLSIGGVLADAATLWRGERDLIVRIAGVMFLLPILALAMLASGMPITEQTRPEDVRGLVEQFYGANMVWLLLISVMLDFGTLALLKLFLDRQMTVRELLVAAGVRLLPFVLLGFATGAIINLGFTLFVIPGIYLFARSWMMGAAYAAAPQQGLFAAIERGFRLSSGNGWRIALLGVGVAIVAGSGAMALLIVAQMLTALAGGAQWVQAVALVPVAAAGAATYVAFLLVRVAIYRRLAGSSNGI